MQADEEQIAEYVADSLMIVTALNEHIGYDKSAESAKHAHKHKLRLKEAVVGLGHLTEEEFDRLVQPKKMTQPGGIRVDNVAIRSQTSKVSKASRAPPVNEQWCRSDL